ncbi:MAG: NYN domain-containing protein, partial [Acidimicrobiales bacterium]
MPPRHVVVDGSNIATEGRSLPSLDQLDQAVQEFQREYPSADVTVVVDATFGHRIDPAERPLFEEAEAHAEVVSPPAGAIGRGDAFLLLIAERTGATVLSNDSFQEFHGEHEWLFDKDRLIGGKPVPGVGWIFTPRTPVRGPRSREATKDARRNRVRVGSKEASQPMPVPKAPPPRKVAAAVAEVESARQAGTKAVASKGNARMRKAIDAATKEAEAPDSTSARRRRRRRGAGPPPQAVNEPLAFITFVAEHPLGSEVEGEVESFTSHGAFVAVDGAMAYVPLSGLGDPAPTRARAVLNRGERRPFVLQALDAQRRGLELALPEFARVTGSPSAETVKAEIAETEVSAGEGAKQPAAQVASDGAVGPAAAAERVSAPPPAKRTRKRVTKPAEPAAAEPPPGPEPAPAKRTRKRPAKPAEPAEPAETAETAEAGLGEPVPAAAASEPAPAKRTRKRAAKPAEPAAASEHAPAKRTRTRATKPAEPAAANPARGEPAAAAAASEEAPAKRTGKRVTKSAKPAEPAAASEPAPA